MSISEKTSRRPNSAPPYQDIAWSILDRGRPLNVAMRGSEIRDSRIPAHISDDALDDYITELIVEEARMKDPAYQREYQRSAAARIFARPREPSTRTNKRFLASMIRNADSHNQRRSAHGLKGEKERPRQRTSRWDLAPGSSRERVHHDHNHAENATIPSRNRSRSPSYSKERPSEPEPRPSPKVRLWDLGKNVCL